jgi:predicted dehydrogenase
MTVRIAVVGAGHMGKLHAEKVAAVAEEARLVAVVDVEHARARSLASRTGARPFAHVRELVAAAADRSDQGLDAAIVAVPTVEHFEVVSPLLEAGLDVLVEKPIAASLDQAQRLLAVAKAHGRVLQVGHLEWFNSAMRVIREYIRRPLFVEAHRMGPFPARATDIDVVRDLMIHDLDILQQVLGEEPERIEAVGIPVLTTNVDIANARISYPGGCVANLTASRVSATPMRKLRFFQSEGYFSIDLLAQSAMVFRRELDAEGGAPNLQMEKLEVDPEDALLAQLRSFLQAVRSREKPAVDGDAGVGALRTALRVVDAMPTLDELE